MRTRQTLKTCPCFKGIATSVSAYCCGLYILKTCPCCKGIAIKNADGCRRFFFWLRQPHRGIRNHANRRRRLGAPPIFLDVGHEWPTYVCGLVRIVIRGGLLCTGGKTDALTPAFPRERAPDVGFNGGQGPPYRRIAITIGCASAHHSQYLLRVIIFVDYR